MPFLSVIIPVYNVENYLEECLNSILSQNINDYEVILVDDASTDKSGNICDEYAFKYENIRVIHLKVNSLPAGARNVGLKNAAGEYVHFCDSDDYYLENSFLEIEDNLKINAPDVLVGQFTCKPEKGAFFCADIEFDFDIFKSKQSSVVVEYFNKHPKIIYTPWRFIINKNFLIKNDLTFLEGYHVEDEEWAPKVICCANKFSLLRDPFYCYRPRVTGSITSNKTYLHTKAHIVIAMKLLNFLNTKQYKGVRKEFIIIRVKFLLGLFSTRCDTLGRNHLQEIANVIEGNMKSFKILSTVSQDGDLFDFIYKYGAYIGLCIYKTYNIEKTLEIVKYKENKDIYCFPTGYNGESTARILKKSGYNVKGFFDNSDTKNGCMINELPVILPSAIKKFNIEQLDNIFVLVTVQNKQTAEILKEQLRSFGLKDSQFASRIYQ